MRVALFAVVTAAHVIAVWLLLTWLRKEPGAPPESWVMLATFLEPEPPRVDRESRRAPLVRVRPKAMTHAAPAAVNTTPSAEPASVAAAPIDWHAQADIMAGPEAQRLVEEQDAAERRAHALTSPFKPMEPDRKPGPQFGWDYATTRRVRVIPGHGVVFQINDHCQAVLIFVLPFVGCTIGKIEANGHLLDHVRDPPKIGDWDWRKQAP